LRKTLAFTDQKPGTSGLRKKVKHVTSSKNYLENFVQSIFDTESVQGKTLIVGGDGRYHNDAAILVILQMAKANGAKKVILGAQGLLSTPALSHLIRKKEAIGGILLTASHNPGGVDGDFGIKFNCANGGPAPEEITDAIFENSKKITRFLLDESFKLKATDYAKAGEFGDDSFKVEVIDPTEDYIKLMKTIFDFDALKTFLTRKDFSFRLDGMHGVAGPYVKALFCDELGVSETCMLNCEPKPDFGGGHPDPNLTVAEQLRDLMGLNATGLPNDAASDEIPDFGAAFDGDADRNMILGKQFFVTPSDSVAAIAAHAEAAIPYFKDGVKGVARSMPTSKALDRVAQEKGWEKGTNLFETPTGWKFFGSLMDNNSISICGEESFGTGADHVREKDGIWAVLAWLSILAHENKETEQGKLKSVEAIMQEFWGKYGRVYYQRLDFESRPNAEADALFANIVKSGETFGVAADAADAETATLKAASNGYSIFSYTDPHSKATTDNQGWIFEFAPTENGKSGNLKYTAARAIFRKSGTGSDGATIRMYLEVESTNGECTATEMCQELREIATRLAGIPAVLTTGKGENPDVVT